MDKTRPVVVADAGPIIHLDELACLDILTDFGKVHIPEAVWLEVLHHRPGAMSAFPSLFLRQTPLKTSPLVTALTPLYTLHSGEQEALYLCAEYGTSLLLTDDTAARLAAKSLGIAAHGTLGLLIRAIRRQSRSKAEVLTLLRQIPTQTTLHIRPTLLAEVIADVEANAK
ncbi:MAG: DNA-binding protein [Methylococcales bacterium]|nr:DNA-binding protein [Methylococcales bacterium]